MRYADTISLCKNYMLPRIIITGGTIDSTEIDDTNTYVFTNTHIPEALEQSKNMVSHTLEVLFLKDSLDMTDEDRERILTACHNAPEERIVITHGTDTMAQTAKMLGLAGIQKTIVLTGAMTPLVRDTSDGLFNLGSAITSVQCLPVGVYIAMNGRIFNWDNVRKNKERGVFEEL